MSENTKTKEEALCKFNEEFIETLNDLKSKKIKLRRKLGKDQKELEEVQKVLDEKNKKKTTLEAAILKKNKQLEIVDATKNSRNISSIINCYQKEISKRLIIII
jgi:hypothetical protein